jgi:hypothetical protein
MRSALEFLNTLVQRGTLTGSRPRNIKSSLNKLAKACETTVDALDLHAVQSAYPDLLDRYFEAHDPDASPHTRRNTVQDIRQLINGLLNARLIRPLAEPITHRPPITTQMIRDLRSHSPYAARMGSRTPHYSLRREHWPEEIRDRFQAFEDEHTMNVRPTTMHAYEAMIGYYVGFCVQIDTSPLTSWNELFEVSRVLRFVNWQAKRIGVKRISSSGRTMFSRLTTIAKITKHPNYEALVERERKLPIPEPMHDKQSPAHTFSADELESVALTLMRYSQRRFNPKSKYSGAARFQVTRAYAQRDALLIRLMWRVPMRSRCFCEMRLGRNLLKDSDGQWVLNYAGDDLKVGERKGRINTFRLLFPPELVEHLDDYLERWRPMLPNAETSPYVFLTRYGAAYNRVSLRERLSLVVYAHTQKLFYPHLCRTLWVDRYLLAGGDISTAAFMLNDNVLTVLKRYHKLRGADHTAKAYAFNEAILGNGQRSSP